MQQYLEDFLPSSENHEIPYRGWLVREPKASIVIAHGMAEHGQRYEYFAEYLNAQGFSVWALDHRGHGEHCNDDDLGYIADQNGWQLVIEDLNRLRDHAYHQQPGTRQVLLGHSMGSYVALASLLSKQHQVTGLIMVGSGQPSRIQALNLLLVAQFEKLRQGSRGISPLLERLTFGNFNNYFRPTKSSYDWLNRDSQQVQQYIDDPFCGLFPCNQFWIDFARGILDLEFGRDLVRLPDSLPILLVSGDKDPVGFFGRSVETLHKSFNRAHMSDVSSLLYPGARHEILNETNYLEVWQDIYQWIEQHTLN